MILPVACRDVIHNSSQGLGAMLVILFWFTAVGGLFSDIVYPFILRFLTGRPRAEMLDAPASPLPLGSLIPTAHNEARHILENIASCPGALGYHHDGSNASKEYHRIILTIIDFLKGRRMTVWTPSKR